MLTKPIAEETIKVLDAGTYTTSGGSIVDISSMLRDSVNRTTCYDPDELAHIRDIVLAQPPKASTTSFEVVNETTLQGCKRLADRQQRIGVLNFASAKNPGGGFLGGAQAQEESLARSSGLYKSLLQCPTYYSFHRSQQTSLYSDRMIYSPDCPVFRTDAGGWLEQPYVVDFITSPAPNAGAILKNEPHNLNRIVPTLRERSSKLLALAAHHSCDVLILGAWGCGVFRNDPQLVAQTFWEHLNADGQYWGRFAKVSFSVYDKPRKPDNYPAFARQFANRI